MIPFWGILHAYKRTENRDICMSVFTAVLFTVTKKWKQPKSLPMDKWMTKTWYIHNETFSFKKQGASDTYNTDGLWKHYAKSSKPVTQKPILSFEWTKNWPKSTLVPRFTNLVYSMILGKMTMILFKTLCIVHERKQNFIKCFCS